MIPRRVLSVAAILLIFLLAGCLHVHLPPPLAALSSTQASQAAVFGRVEVVPGWTQIGILYDVAECLDVSADDIRDDLVWSVADSIKTSDGFYAYGATVLLEGDAAAIIIERPFWFHAAVVSHEVIHAVARVEDHVGAAWGCLLLLPDDLPPREVP